MFLDIQDVSRCAGFYRFSGCSGCFRCSIFLSSHLFIRAFTGLAGLISGRGVIPVRLLIRPVEMFRNNSEENEKVSDGVVVHGSTNCLKVK